MSILPKEIYIFNAAPVLSVITKQNMETRKPNLIYCARVLYKDVDTRRQESLAGVLITTGLYEAEPSEATANTLSQGCLHFKRSQCWLSGGISSTTTGGVRAILKTEGLRSPQTPCQGQSIWIQEHFRSRHVMSSILVSAIPLHFPEAPGGRHRPGTGGLYSVPQ